MTERADIEAIIRGLHAARVRGDLAAMCALFAVDGDFEIAGSGADKPVAISAAGIAAFRPWLSMMSKVFRLTNYELLSVLVDDDRAAAHWRVDILSKVTGVTVKTELIDLMEIRDQQIHSYREFCVPARP